MPGSAPSPLFRRRPNRPSSSAAFASPKRGQDFNLCLHSNQQRSGDTCNYPPTHTYTGALCVVLCVFRYPIACGCHDFGVGLGAMEDLIDWGLSCLHLNLTTNLIKPRPLAGPGWPMANSIPQGGPAAPTHPNTVSESVIQADLAFFNATSWGGGQTGRGGHWLRCHPPSLPASLDHPCIQNIKKNGLLNLLIFDRSTPGLTITYPSGLRAALDREIKAPVPLRTALTPFLLQANRF